MARPLPHPIFAAVVWALLALAVLGFILTISTTPTEPPVLPGTTPSPLL